MTDQEIESLRGIMTTKQVAWMVEGVHRMLKYIGTAPGGYGCEENQEPGLVAYFTHPAGQYIALDNTDVRELFVLTPLTQVLEEDKQA